MTYVNLIPLRTQKRRLILQRCRQWGLAVALTSFLLLTATWYYRQQGMATEHELQDLEDRYQLVRHEHRELRELQREIDRLKNQTSLPASDRRLLNLLGVVSNSAASITAPLYIERFELKPHLAADFRFLLELDGIGENNIAVAQFAASLREKNVFGAVELESAGSRRVGARQLRTFKMHCSF